MQPATVSAGREPWALAALRIVEHRFSHDMADMLVNESRRQLPRLQKQPHPVHDSSTASSFHH